jgi:hypothetical protein
MKTGHVSAFLVCMISTTPSHAQTLWQNVRVGMSADEVLAAVAVAERATEDDPDPLGNGASCDVAISQAIVGGHAFRGCFYFYKRRLLQVTFKSHGNVTEQAYRDVVAAVDAELGDARNDDDACFMATAWGKQRGFHASVLARPPHLLNINYQYGRQPKSDR